jgi:hypothetical protein
MKKYFVILLATLVVSTITVASDEQVVNIREGICVTRKLKDDGEHYHAHYIEHDDRYQFIMVMEPGKIESNRPNGDKLYLRQHLKSLWCPQDQFPNGLCKPLERHLVKYIQDTCHDQ